MAAHIIGGMRRAPLASIALAVAIVPFAAGCGEDTEASSGRATVDAGQPVVVEGDEYSFKPGTITVRAAAGAPGGVPVRFELRNVGTLPHDIHVRRGDEELGGTEAIGGDETARATVKLPPGDYEIYCSIGDHADLGMTGDLKIE
jgi:plastocyanin